MDKFKVGDVVRIQKTSKYYGKHPTADPADKDGIVIRLKDSGFRYRVEWGDGENSYNESDLEFSTTITYYEIY